jgi:excisionase family DNA binding protein
MELARVDCLQSGGYLSADVAELPDILTPEEAAEYLRVDTRTIQRMCKRGELYGVYAGRLLRIPRESIEAWKRGEVYQPRGVVGPAIEGPADGPSDT